jgi:RNA polymerase sporulation-specific sigma factor
VLWKYKNKTIRAWEGEIAMSEKADRNRDLIIRAKEGDAKALNELFRINEGFSRSVAKRYLNTGIEFEELVSMCKLGMVKAYNSFDLEKNISFITYASPCMMNEIRMVLRQKSTHTVDALSVSIEAEIDTNLDGHPISYSDVLADDRIESNVCDLCVQRQEILDMKKIIAELPEKERLIITNIWFYGKKQREVSNILGISQPQICRLEKKALQKIKRKLE